MQWKYRKRMLICNDIFNQECISKSQAKELFNEYKSALLLRYTTNIDNTDSTSWYCCIKDDKYDFEQLKSKRRNVVRKGIENFSVREIKLLNHIDDFHFLVNDAYKGYDIGVDSISYESATKKAKSISENENYFVLGAFPKGSERLVGYLWCHVNEKCISMSEQKAVREFEHDGVNAALLWALCSKYNEEYADDGYYLFDGWKNVLHNTNFQAYLVKYFGFRKAYSDLHIVYNPKYEWWFRPALKIYPIFRFVLKKVSPKACKNIEAFINFKKAVRKNNAKV